MSQSLFSIVHEHLDKVGLANAITYNSTLGATAKSAHPDEQLAGNLIDLFILDDWRAVLFLYSTFFYRQYLFGQIHLLIQYE
ncbi:hypothetical protein EP47_06995 [Legionella norrlandica]|uniref:Uncharacterized protein n=1 Tax=Legionella norrlandica TaxID=1498499 RepID=A0A0A2SWW2_9GAMM|nr:hypothetical protein EP47_06995 [Legionella norrlandica]